MPPESWLVLTVAAAFLLLGIAGSPLAWVLLYHRRSRLEERTEQTWRKLAGELRALEDRLSRHETSAPARTRPPHVVRADTPGLRGGVRAADSFNRAEGGPSSPTGSAVVGGRGSARTTDSAHQPTLIAVPILDGAPIDREVSVTGLKERHAAIWTLADTGAAAEVIARATGQPVGQIELILGLRRQIDGTKSRSSHGPHG